MHKVLPRVLALLALCALSAGAETAQQKRPLSRIDATPYNRAHFLSTQNSCDHKPSLASQLELGVRHVEIGVFPWRVPHYGDFRVGRFFWDILFRQPRKLNASLREIDAWSDQHPSHAPITVVLDLKTRFKISYLYRLNAELEEIFGPKLYRAGTFHGKWPTIGQLRGKVLVVLSDELDSRNRYAAEFRNRAGKDDPREIAFIETESLALPSRSFLAARATRETLADCKPRMRYGPVRLRGFNEKSWAQSHDLNALPNFPATDSPADPRYQNLFRGRLLAK